MRTDEKISSQRNAIATALHERVIPHLLEKTTRNPPRGKFLGGAPMTKPGPYVLARDDLHFFAHTVLSGREEEANAQFSKYLENGATVRGLFLGLLAPTATILGESWLRDEASFGDVTLGGATLHSILRSNAKALAVEFNSPHRNRSILLAPVPGSNHLFGVAMVEEFFRADGWDVQSGINENSKSLVAHVGDDGLDIVGLSVGATDQLKKCGELIGKMRAAAVNSELRIMIGGPVFTNNPTLANTLDADGLALNADEAITVAAKLCGIQSGSAFA